MAPLDFVSSMDSVNKEQLPLLIFASLCVVLISTQIGNISRYVSVIVSRWYLQTFVLNSKKAPISSTIITRLYTYPVKSLRAVECESVMLDEKGFVGDRRLMLVTKAPTPIWGSFGPNDATHRFLTQRQCPSLATVIVKQQGTTITLSSHMFPNRKVTISTMPDPTSSPKYRASLWNDIVLVQDLGDTAASFLKDIVQQDETVADEYKSDDVRLVVQCPEDDRSADAKYVPASARTLRGNKTPAVALSDGFPLLLANEASLKELNKRLKDKGKQPLKMSNFRPNIVVKGKEPFEEDRWKVIRIGSAVFHVVKGCPRCKQSCTDQITGIVREEPLETLAEFRAMTRNPNNLYFAQNVLPAADNPKGYALRKGDKVEVLQVGEPVWDD